MTQAISIIDPHLHLFNLDRGDYHWLKAQTNPHSQQLTAINKNFTQRDLQLRLPLHLDGFVHIEAGFDNDCPWREIDWLHQHCTLPMRAVAGIDLVGQQFAMQLEALKHRSSVVGVRYILDEHAARTLSQPLVQHRLSELAQNGLHFEAQFNLADQAATENLARYLCQQPNAQVVINHAGLPIADPMQKALWQRSIVKLAQFPNLMIKLSGWEMQTQAQPWQSFKTVLNYVLHYFGNQRIMLGSNFPLCTWTGSYAQLWQGYLCDLNEGLKTNLLRHNAYRFYRFEH